MAETFVAVLPSTDPAALKIRNVSNVVGADTVLQQVTTLALQDGTFYDPRSIANLDAALSTRLADGTFTARINTQGQKAMTASTPVVIASDQSSLPTTEARLPTSLVGGRLDANVGAWMGSVAPTIGQKAMTSSLPVVIASDQSNLPIRALVSTDTVTARLNDGAGSSVTIGQKAMTSSLPVAIASDQSNLPANIAQVGATTVVTSIAGALGVGGDTADGSADAGKSLKVGGKVVLNAAALPTALTASQRGPLMVDEYGRPRVVVNRPKLLGEYYFESGRLAVLAAAHASTAGFFWIINPVGSTVIVVIKSLQATTFPVAATAFTSAPRITVERMTFTGTASGAQITAAKRDSNDATATATIRTASTGLTPTAGAVIDSFPVAPVITAVGIPVPTEMSLYQATRDDDDGIVLRAGEGVVVRQADAGTASDTRIAVVTGSWEER